MGDKLSDLGKVMEAFFRTFPDYEDVDKLIPQNPKGMYKADHLLFNKAVVAEQKDLEEYEFRLDPSFYEFETAMKEKYGLDPETGGLILNVIDEKERTRFRHEIMDAGTTIKRLMKKADSQIRDTKLQLDIPKASGLLILFSDSRPDLLPQYVNYFLFDKLKPDHRGKVHYPEIDAVFVAMRLKGIAVGGMRAFAFGYTRSRDTRAYKAALDAVKCINAQSKGFVMGGHGSDHPEHRLIDMDATWDPPA